MNKPTFAVLLLSGLVAIGGVGQAADAIDSTGPSSTGPTNPTPPTLPTPGTGVDFPNKTGIDGPDDSPAPGTDGTGREEAPLGSDKSAPARQDDESKPRTQTK